MRNLNNVKQTKANKAKYNSQLLVILQNQTTRDELVKQLQVSDREARSQVQECSLYYPVISGSNCKGYRLAKSIDNLNEKELQKEIETVERCVHEYESRKKAIKKRQRALIAWLSVAKKKQQQEAQQ